MVTIDEAQRSINSYVYGSGRCDNCRRRSDPLYTPMTTLSVNPVLLCGACVVDLAPSLLHLAHALQTPPQPKTSEAHREHFNADDLARITGIYRQAYEEAVRKLRLLA